MGQPAFQYDEFEDIEPIEVPAGGIATFLTATEGSWATDDDDDIPQAGIASVKRVADQLATFGRHEDEYMIHAAEGETVIPMEVFRKNPILKERIFQQMRDMGIEPERYVVGNELNSLNPVTGQPEFFLKKLFKGLKKFVKKAVTVVLPIVGAAFLGPLGAAAGSGIATLINGGNLKDALKSAAISGLTAGVMNGISGGMSAAGEGGSFFQGARAGAFGEGAFTRTIGEAATAGANTVAQQTAAAAAVSPGPELASKVDAATGDIPLPDVPVTEATIQAPPGSPIQGDYAAEIAGEIRNQRNFAQIRPDQMRTQLAGLKDPLLEEAVMQNLYATGPTPTLTTTPAATTTTQTVTSAAPSASTSLTTPVEPISQQRLTDAMKPVELPDVDVGKVSADAGQFQITGDVGAGAGTASTATTVPVSSFRQGIDRLLPGGELGFDPIRGFKDVFMPRAGQRAAAEELVRTQQPGLAVGSPNFEAAVKKIMDASSKPGFFRSYAPAIGGIMALDALSRQEPETYNVDEQVTGFTILGGPEGSRYRLGPNTMKLPTSYKIQDVSDQYSSLQTPIFAPQPGGKAEGGEIDHFPRMNGRIDGPGTETSDDIPAMLSDGEFVFTAKAVRGAGNGNRENGMKNMYALMSKFERMA
jgi:hypothetical protein